MNEMVGQYVTLIEIFNQNDFSDENIYYTCKKTLELYGKSAGRPK